jgi:hypothetical protein
MDQEQPGTLALRSQDGAGTNGSRPGMSFPPNLTTHGSACHHRTRAVSEAGLEQLHHHLTKATEKSVNRHVHQAMLVLQHMLEQP